MIRILPYLIILLPLFARAQERHSRIKYCPPKALKSSAIQELCAEALPKTGAILLGTEQGEPCWCRCVQQNELSDHELNRLRKIRNAKYASNARAYALKQSNYPDSVGSWKDRAIVSFTNGDHSIDSVRLCAIDREMIATIIRVMRMDSIPFSEMRFCLANEITEDAFPSILRDQIMLPRRFLDDMNVGKELRLFMLLHEVGHYARDNDNEYVADDWAARIGLPDFFGPAWKWIGPDYLRTVTNQLTAYLYSQYVPEHVTSAINTGSDIANYPQLHCRNMGILGAFVRRAQNVSYDRGYPTALPTCWTPALERRQLKTCPFAMHPCEALCHAPLDLCRTVPRLCRVRSKIDDLLMASVSGKGIANESEPTEWITADPVPHENDLDRRAQRRLERAFKKAERILHREVAHRVPRSSVN